MDTKTALLLSGVAGVVLWAAPARAEDAAEESNCSGEVMLEVGEGYLYPNYGINVAPGAIVFRNRDSYTCGPITLRLQNSAELSSNGTYGHRGLVDEIQLGVAYRDDVRTPLGTFAYGVSVDYLALDMGQGLGVSRDDYIRIKAELAYPVKMGPVKFTPRIGADKDIPVGSNNPLYWGKGAVRLDINDVLPGNASFYVDVTFAHNVNSTTAVPHKNVWYGEAGLSKPFGHGWKGTVGVRFAQYAERDNRFAYDDIRQDGRIDPYPRSGRKLKYPETSLFGRLTWSY